MASEDNQSPPKKQQVNMLESTADISVEVLRPSPVKKQRKQQKTDEFGRFASAEPFSASFITEYCLFRTKFHEARPTGSHNDFGWHNQLVKEWPKWVDDKRAYFQAMPTYQRLVKLWASYKTKNRTLPAV